MPRYKISKAALEIINTPAIRHELAGFFPCTEQTVIRYIHKNEVNGPLTTVAVVEFLKAHKALSKTEILVDENIQVT